ncbi:sodium:calcium antiporter [Candidatus Gottesmanbacteria bacterium]|nr:sodium:calcium antiporter [Candidatus Gottesmanbacteria bacterium]
MFFLHILTYISSFIFIWIGAGLIVSSTDRFSRKLRLSTFAVSFIILGILTSSPEFAVGLTAIAESNPEIFVGNLLGGVPVIFLFIIPILAIFGNGINLKHDLDRNTLLATLGVILIPFLLVIDKKITNPEGILLILLYIVLIFLIERRHGIFDRKNTEILNIKSYSYRDIIRVLVGVGIVFVSSQIIVDKTMYFSSFFNISAFYISLIILSLGTNLPELSLAIRSITLGSKDIAFGDYMGSAAANTLLFGVFTLLNNGEILTVNNFLFTFVYITMGLTLFYFFSRSKNNISRTEGLILLIVYLTFVIVELV